MVDIFISFAFEEVCLLVYFNLGFRYVLLRCLMAVLITQNLYLNIACHIQCDLFGLRKTVAQTVGLFTKITSARLEKIVL